MILVFKNSIWKIFKKGKTPRLIAVVGIWATGYADKYQPVAYDLKDQATGSIITISREKMLDLIESGRMIREQ